MKLLTASHQNPKKIKIDLSNLTYIKSMRPLFELLEGEGLENPIEVIKHTVSKTPRYGVNGMTYLEKEYSVFRGSQRVQAAKELGYTHIEAIII